MDGWSPGRWIDNTRDGHCSQCSANGLSTLESAMDVMETTLSAISSGIRQRRTRRPTADGKTTSDLDIGKPLGTAMSPTNVRRAPCTTFRDGGHGKAGASYRGKIAFAAVF
jgi:hypothetical protein